MNREPNKKYKKTIITLLTVAFFALLLIIGTSYFYIRHKIYVLPEQKKLNDKILNQYIGEENEGSEDEEYDEYKIKKRSSKEEEKYEEQKGITNILLIGTDGRSLEERPRSDSIIVATIDDNNKNIKLTSIMRDSYVNIQGCKAQKINAAYALGGPELLMSTIEKNFKIKLDRYVLVNFWGFQDIIDGIGGIDIDIKDYEIKEMNKYIGEVSNNKSPKISKAGIQRLDGQQALAYTRIRHVGNGSYERNLRQRVMLSTIAIKLKDTSIFQYPSLLSKILPHIRTNIEPAAVLNYVYTAFSFKPLEVKQLQMPLTELSEGRMYKGSWVILMDKEQNADVLNDFIFRNASPDKEKINYTEYKRKINEYIRAERKANPTIKNENYREINEPLENDHSIFNEY